MNSRQNTPFHVPLPGKQTFLNFVILAVLLAVIMPATLDIFRLNLLGKYLSYAFVAIGLVPVSYTHLGTCDGMQDADFDGFVRHCQSCGIDIAGGYRG